MENIVAGNSPFSDVDIQGIRSSNGLGLTELRGGGSHNCVGHVFSVVG